MKAAWYEKQGPARDVLTIGEMPDPKPGPGDVRVRISASGINPGDTKKRGDVFGVGMPFPRVIPHSDGAGIVDQVGPGVSVELLGARVWCFGAQSYRPFGTAAEFTVLPVDHVVRLPPGVSFEAGACLGIPGITAHRAVHVGGPVAGRVVLVQGGAGSVGSCAVQLARFAGARVIATVRSNADADIAAAAGAHDVVVGDDDVLAEIRRIAPDGVDHVVEVAFAANIERNVELLRQGGTLAVYATNEPAPTIPVWPMIFKNLGVHFLGSDDFPMDAKVAAAEDLNRAMEAGWPGFNIGERLPLDRIAEAHDQVDRHVRPGRVVLVLD